ncbi:MAG: IS91 family transposase [Lachnotalea sp.]
MGDHVTMQDVFERFHGEYIKKYKPSPQQAKAAYHIMNCKTGSLGSNMSYCEDCGSIHYHHNSCRDRNCPMCQELPKEKWIDAQKENVLDAPYFHVVFTLPEELNSLIYGNQKVLYDLLYRCSSEIILELSADEKYLNAKVGFLSVLHTWGSSMNFHPHLHLVVLGGGLDKDSHWKTKGDKFFLPVKVISKVFRGKYLSGVKELYKGKKLLFHGTCEKYKNHYQFQSLLDDCYAKEWVPYCKKTFQNAYSVIEYLGRYTHRIAISNHRIVSMNQQNVTYRVKDYKNNGTWTTMTVCGVEFIRRFLMHVLPKRYVRIRSYGLLCNRSKRNNLTRCRNLIGCEKYISSLKNMKTDDILKHLFRINVHICPDCGSKKYGKAKINILNRSTLKKDT